MRFFDSIFISRLTIFLILFTTKFICRDIDNPEEVVLRLMQEEASLIGNRIEFTRRIPSMSEAEFFETFIRIRDQEIQLIRNQRQFVEIMPIVAMNQMRDIEKLFAKVLGGAIVGHFLVNCFILKNMDDHQMLKKLLEANNLWFSILFGSFIFVNKNKFRQFLRTYWNLLF